MNNPKKAQVDGWPVQTWIRHYPNDDDLPRLGSLVFAAAVSTKPGAAQPRLSSVQASWAPALRICWQLGTEEWHWQGGTLLASQLTLFLSQRLSTDGHLFDSAG